jgi:hypothetical protein
VGELSVCRCSAEGLPLPPQAFDSLELTEEKIHAITDKIPQKPVTIVEGTSYMVIILGAFAVSNRCDLRNRRRSSSSSRSRC